MARQPLTQGQVKFDLGLGAAAPVRGPLEIVAARMSFLWDALCRAYDTLGLDDVAQGDEVFRDLLAGIIEPTSSWAPCESWPKSAPIQIRAGQQILTAEVPPCPPTRRTRAHPRRGAVFGRSRVIGADPVCLRDQPEDVNERSVLNGMRRRNNHDALRA